MKTIQKHRKRTCRNDKNFHIEIYLENFQFFFTFDACAINFIKKTKNRTGRKKKLAHFLHHYLFPFLHFSMNGEKKFSGCDEPENTGRRLPYYSQSNTQKYSISLIKLYRTNNNSVGSTLTRVNQNKELYRTQRQFAFVLVE